MLLPERLLLNLRRELRAYILLHYWRWLIKATANRRRTNSGWRNLTGVLNVRTDWPSLI